EIIASVTVQGNDVKLFLTRPYGNLLTEFMTYSVIPQHIWKSVEEPLKYEGSNMVVGSGPFTFESWDAAAGKFVFSANEDYFQGEPNVDRLEVNVYRTMDALVMALANGEIDTWWDYSGEFPYTHVPPLLKSGNIAFATATYLGVPAAIGFNLETGPAADLAFRQAVAAAVDYDQIAEIVFSGYGSTPTGGFVPPTHPDFDNSLSPLTQDLDRAGLLLESLGYLDTNGDGIRQDTHGNDLTVTLLTRGDMATTLRTTEMVAADLRSIGIESDVRAVDNATWIAAKDAMDYDLVFFRATPWGTLMHASHGSGYFDARRTGAGVLHTLSAKDYLATCDARLATADPAEQEILDLQLQQMHAEYLPGIALTWIDSIYPYREGWENWTIDHIYGGVVNSFSWFTVTRD
ncbi:MAG: ABC transporter substrate-binding protein, partial [Dehalococcoidia bacterium]|nr:ABC transporter substrate-binding protein [Dehalococcoidia bacterium]